jgi:hypothetical protein
MTTMVTKVLTEVQAADWSDDGPEHLPLLGDVFGESHEIHFSMGER